jgi:RND family efflux transporter MFP subunit
MSKPSRPPHLALIAGAAAIVAALAWISAAPGGIAAAESAAPGQAKTAKATKAALTVSVTQATPAEWPLTLSANGNIAAWQEAIIGAEAGGLRLAEVLVNVGDRVRKGQVLARLQSDTVGAEVEQTRASLQEAVATQAEAAANAERARQLQSTGAMSTQQINQFLTGEQTARARVAVLKARLKADRTRLAQTSVQAPDDGSISARLATLGAVVQPGQELFRLIRRDRLEWRAEVPASDLPRVRPGMKATIFSASGSPAPGTIRMVAPTVDAQTRNGLVYVDITQARDAKAGMFARGEIDLGNTKALTLPQAAVQMRDGFHYVFRLADDNTVAQTKVSVGRRSGERIEILDGIDASQRVVASGVGFLVDGDTVRVVAEPAASGQPAVPAQAPAAAGQAS